MPHNKTSPVWNYFYQDTSKTVKCTLCDSTLKYFGSTSNMSAHFKNKHGAPVNSDANSQDQDSFQCNVKDGNGRQQHPTKLGSARKSCVWIHFTQNSPKEVTCDICHNILTYSGNTTNMIYHLKAKHQNNLNATIFKTPCKKFVSPSSRSSSPALSTDENKSSKVHQTKKRSSVWKFFKQEGSKTVKCTICSTTLKYCGSTTNMINHFKTKHGKENGSSEQLSFIKTEKTKHENSDDGSDYEMLNKSESRLQPVTAKREMRSSSLKRKCADPLELNEHQTNKIDGASHQGDCSKTSEPVVLENELDIFGRYVAAQLKNLTTQQALQAQKSILSLLMDIRLNALIPVPQHVTICETVPPSDNVQSDDHNGELEVAESRKTIEYISADITRNY